VPSVIVFDINETLPDMAPVAELFTGVGAPGHLAPLWFASLLRDGFALTTGSACSTLPAASPCEPGCKPGEQMPNEWRRDWQERR